MYQYLKFILPAYLMVYFFLLLIVPAIVVRKRIGKNPIVLSSSDDAHGLIGKYFLTWMLLICIYILCLSLYPASYSYFMPMKYILGEMWTVCGLVILVISLIWTSAAQINMQSSWKVGIDEKQKTELVKTGIFRYSRNPIYLGMMASLVGLFLVTPGAFTLLLLTTGYLLIQIQVRLEEEYLCRTHGQGYIDYKNSTRRFI